MEPPWVVKGFDVIEELAFGLSFRRGRGVGEALTRALSERTQIETAAPQRLEGLITTLSEKIEQLQQSDDENIAAAHLENRIVDLMKRIDASESRLDKLDAIERGLADLLVHIEELRANRQSTAIRDEGPGMDLLAQDVAYTRKSLDAVHRRLGDLFDRFASVPALLRLSTWRGGPAARAGTARVRR